MLDSARTIKKWCSLSYNSENSNNFLISFFGFVVFWGAGEETEGRGLEEVRMRDNCVAAQDKSSAYLHFMKLSFLKLFGSIPCSFDELMGFCHHFYCDGASPCASRHAINHFFSHMPADLTLLQLRNDAPIQAWSWCLPCPPLNEGRKGGGTGFLKSGKWHFAGWLGSPRKGAFIGSFILMRGLWSKSKEGKGVALHMMHKRGSCKNRQIFRHSNEPLNVPFLHHTNLDSL